MAAAAVPWYCNPHLATAVAAYRCLAARPLSVRLALCACRLVPLVALVVAVSALVSVLVAAVVTVVTLVYLLVLAVQCASQVRRYLFVAVLPRELMLAASSC